jgi:ATP-binding cassette subfamily B protein
MGFQSMKLLATLGRVGAAVETYQRTMVSVERILDVLDREPQVHSGEIRPAAVKGDIVFDGVVFGYEPDRPVLRGAHLHFEAGKTTAIVGVTGAGKSTILKLILRFYDAQSGAVRLDDTDVRALVLDDLRRAVSLVSQDVFLCHGTIRENIAYGRPDAPMDEVVRAARIAEAHDFIEQLPRGYDTPVGERGSKLSGGQRQRVAIARAVLADRPIFLFDEATSSVDTETEGAIQRSLREITAGRTTIIVAHRLSTVRHADLIYVMDAGQVREAGRHDDLIEQGGAYAGFWRIQTGQQAAAPVAMAK